MVNNIAIEICAGSILDVKNTLSFPIDRIELNSAIELGGLTPSLSTLRHAKILTQTPIFCMVRPRGGGFCYSEEEFAVMMEDAEALLDNGADGLVFGFLDEHKHIDLKRSQEMINLVKKYQKTAVYHKAFDEIADQDEAIQQLIALGIDRILTSGKAKENILDGLMNLKHLQDVYGKRIEILPGGGVTANNAYDVIHKTGVHTIHMTAKSYQKDGYYACNPQVLDSILKAIAR